MMRLAVYGLAGIRLLPVLVIGAAAGLLGQIDLGTGEAPTYGCPLAVTRKRRS